MGRRSRPGRKTRSVSAHWLDPLESRLLLAVSLVYDHNTDTNSSSPGGVYLLNGAFYFVATNSSVGTEFYKSDGTPAGTSLFSDINPGSASSAPRAITLLGDSLLFYANSPGIGSELWKTDGSSAGTVLIKDIFPGPSSSGIRQTAGGAFFNVKPIVFHGRAFFDANDGVAGHGLWVTDGTSDGTVLFKDLLPGLANSDPANFKVIGDTLYFTATDSTGTSQIWKSDGSAEGTVPITSLSGGLAIPEMAWFSNSFIFITRTGNSTGIWRTDDSQAGAIQLNNAPSDASDLVVSNGIAYFSGWSGLPHIWRSDGTPAGTLPIDVPFQPVTALPANLTDFDGTLLFTATDSHGNELWRTDGTKDGTILVKDINTQTTSSDSSPGNLTVFDHKLYFAATGAAGRELWVSGGATANTTLFADLNPTGSSSPSVFSIAGNRLFFAANTPRVSNELYWTDGQSPPALVADVNTDTLSSTISTLVPFAGRFFYMATDPLHGRELWSTDGTPQGTSMLLDLRPGPLDGALVMSMPAEISTTDQLPGAVAGGSFFFIGDDGTGPALWKTDGTAAGTLFVKRFRTDGTPGIYNMTAVGNLLVMNANDNNYGYQPWVSDGTPQGTRLLMVQNPPTYMSTIDDSTASFTPFGGWLFFKASDTAHGGHELWKTDGTPQGTSFVKDIYPGDFWGDPILPPVPAILNGFLYFTAISANFGRELWKTDGTDAGTTRLSDIDPGASDSSPKQFAVLGNYIYFAAKDSSGLFKLWRTDGSSPPAQITTKTGIANIRSIGGYIYFSDSTSTIYKYDGANLSAGVTPPTLMEFLRATDGNRLFFHTKIDNASQTYQLWQSDGTAAGTHRVGGASPLTQARNERWLDGALYFSANSVPYGNELWKLVPPSVQSSSPSGRSISFTFSDDLADGLVASADLRNVSTGQQISSVGPLSFSPGMHRATVSIPDLSEGYYSLTLPASAITDANGNAMSADFVYYFFIAPGSSDSDAWRLASSGGNVSVYKNDSPIAQANLPLSHLDAMIFDSPRGQDTITLSNLLPPQVALDISGATLLVPTTPAEKDAAATALRLSIRGGQITSSLFAANSNLTLALTSTDTLITTRPALIGDLNLDNNVSIADFMTLAAHFQQSGDWQDGDINSDGQISIADFIGLSVHFGQSLPAAPQAAASAQIISTSSTDALHEHRRSRPQRHFHRRRPAILVLVRRRD